MVCGAYISCAVLSKRKYYIYLKKSICIRICIYKASDIRECVCLPPGLPLDNSFWITYFNHMDYLLCGLRSILSDFASSGFILQFFGLMCYLRTGLSHLHRAHLAQFAFEDI